MKLEISNEKVNKLLSRKEVQGRLIFNEITPSNVSVRAEMAKKFDTKPDCVRVIKIETKMSHREADFEAYIYETKELHDSLTKKGKKELEKEKKAEEKKKEQAEKKAGEKNKEAEESKKEETKVVEKTPDKEEPVKEVENTKPEESKKEETKVEEKTPDKEKPKGE